MKIPEYVTAALEKMQREAFDQGWQSATSALVQAASSTRPISPMASTPPESVALVSSLLAASTNRERITIALSARPGMRPPEVYGWLAQMGLKLNKQSVLTAMKRMRGTDIEKVGEGYRVKERTA